MRRDLKPFECLSYSFFFFFAFRKGTGSHIISVCSRALGDERYSWRHDQVLSKVDDTVDAAISADSFKPEAR